MKLTPGKLAGMKAVANDRGIIAAAAMDQRGSLQKSLSAASPINAKPIGDHEMEEFKTLVTEVLTRYASAILLDPEWGLPASKARATGSGLLLAYEKTGYDATTPGRLPDLLDLWSVQRLKEAGADCIKILLYYSSTDDPGINDLKQAWIERIGDECRANDIPFFLEFVTYQTGTDEKGLEFARIKPQLVSAAMEEFSHDKYGVDVLKVEVPVNMQFVQGAACAKTSEYAYTRPQAAELFRKAASVAGKPFIYLSAGVSNEEFTETLALATEAGTRYSGVLCGRATWKDGVKIYAAQGPAAFKSWLESKGVENIQNVNHAIQGATPWFQFYGADSADALAE